MGGDLIDEVDGERPLNHVGRPIEPVVGMVGVGPTNRVDEVQTHAAADEFISAAVVPGVESERIHG